MSDNAGTNYWADTNEYAFQGLDNSILTYITQNNLAVFSVVPDAALDVKFNASNFNTNITTQTLSLRQLISSSPKRGKILGATWKDSLHYLNFKNVDPVTNIKIDNNTVTITLNDPLSQTDQALINYIKEQTNLQDSLGNEIADLTGVPLTNTTNVPVTSVPNLIHGLLFTDVVGTINNGISMIHLGSPSVSGNTFRYKISSNANPVPLPLVGDNVSLWQPITNNGTISVIDGQYVGVAEVDPTNKVIQFSNAKAVVITE
jgi:hypothetical protein